MRVITASADIKYRDLELRVGQREDSLSYGRRYLEKMVQIQFDLPVSELTGMDRIISVSEREWNEATAESEKSQQPALGRAQKLKDRRTLRARMTWRILGRLESTGEKLAIPSTVFTVALAIFIDQRFGPFPTWVVLALFVLPWLIPFLLLTALANRLRAYTQAIQRDIDAEIIRSALATDTSVVDVESRVASSRAAERAGPWLLRQRVRHYLIESSYLRDEVVQEIRKHLPPLPRSAKRIYNHAHLVLSIAVGRAVLGGYPRLEARHLGKWIVFLERWPVLAQAVHADTALMARLESAVAPEALAKLLEETAPGVEESDELLSFVTSDPQLAPIVNRLVHLSPVVGRAIDSSQPVSSG